MTLTEKINHQNDIGNHHWRVHERTKLLENLGGNVDYRFGEIVLGKIFDPLPLPSYDLLSQDDI